MSQLSEHEQQQVDIASENYEADYFNKPEAKGPLDHFKAGVDFALDHLLPGRMERLVDALKEIRTKCYVEEINDPGQLLFDIMSIIDKALSNYNKPDK